MSTEPMRDAFDIKRSTNRIASISIERLKEMLEYNAETGRFIWRVSTTPHVRMGAIAGRAHSARYLSIQIDRKQYLSHRLAWFYVCGVWPEAEIDHINGNKIDNRISNLRDVSGSVNMQNQPRASAKNKSSGLLGASRSRSKWKAQINVKGRSYFLGQFDTAELAHNAYIAAKRKFHQGCTI